MSYEITDIYHILNIRLVSKIYTTDFMLGVYKSDNMSASTPNRTYVATPVPTPTPEEEYEYTFRIPHNDFAVGDVLDRFILEQSGTSSATIPIWETTDGVTILVDGEFHSKIHSNTFKLKFDNSGEHSVQAVYSGDEYTKMSYTDLERFEIKQHKDSPTPPPSIVGKYALKFHNPSILKDLTFNDHKKVYFKLTQGGKAVSGKTIEIQLPNGSVVSKTTSKGLVSFPNTGYSAGKYKIGAYFVDSETHKRYTSTYKDITIKKADVHLDETHEKVMKKGVYQKKRRVVIFFRNAYKKPFKKRKLSVYHNKQLKTMKTDDNGHIIMDVGVGTHTFKVVYNGNNDYNKKTLNFTVVVEEK